VADTLSPEERGFVAAAALLGLEKAAVDRALAGDGAQRAWAALGAVPVEQRAPALAQLLRDGPAIADLHPGWAHEALAGEPTGLALALAQDSSLAGAAVALARSRGEEVAPWPLDPQVRQELARLLVATLEPLTTEPAGPLGRALGALDSESLEQELCRWGARTIGASLAGAPLELRARAMASAGAPWSVQIASAAARPTEPAARERARHLVARAATLPALTPLHRLRAVGLLAVAPLLAAC
jgi:hypothetical protein